MKDFVRVLFRTTLIELGYEIVDLFALVSRVYRVMSKPYGKIVDEKFTTEEEVCKFVGTFMTVERLQSDVRIGIRKIVLSVYAW